MTGRPGERLESTALVAATGVLAVGAAVVLGYARRYHPVPFALDFRTTPYHGASEISTHLSTIKYFFDARGQSLAHLTMTAAIAALAFVGLRGRARFLPAWSAAPLVLLLLAAWAWLPGPRAIAYAASLLAFGLLVALGRFLAAPLLSRIFALVLVAAWAVVVLPGFLHAPDYTGVPWWEVLYGESHDAVIVAPADLLGAGRRLFDDVRPDYGLVLPVLVGGYERLVGALTLGGIVRVLLGLQALYLAIAGFLYFRHARGRALLALFAFLTVMPWFHFAHKGLRFPNQTPWRTLGMALGLVVLVALSGRARRGTLALLGFTSGMALLLNFESGVAVTVACAVWAAFRFGLLGRPGQGRLESVGLFALGLFASVAVVALLVPLLLGQALPLLHLPELVANAAFTASAGYSGWPLTRDPWPVVMFAHAAASLLLAAFRARAPASARASFRAAAAALVVVWFAYYANRPHPWNLSSYALPYGVLLIDLLRTVELRLRRRLWSAPLAVALAALLLVILPNLVFQAGKGARQVAAALPAALRGAAPAGGRLLSGVWLADPEAAELEERARFIREQAGREPLYLTSNSYLVPKLSGVFAALPVVDFCWQATTRRQYEAVLAVLLASAENEVFLDAPGTHTHAASYCTVFYEKVREDLGAGFERGPTLSGWEVWKRRAK